MLKFLKRLKCKHDYRVTEVIYGDRINYLGARNIQRCTKCDKEILGRKIIRGNKMKNKVIIIEGAQGVGKGTITNILREQMPYTKTY